MKLTTKGRFAVTAMIDVAMHNAQEPVTLAEVSERQKISLSYLEQLFGKLRRAGLVASVRGPGGGYNLARPSAMTGSASVSNVAYNPADQMTAMTHDGLVETRQYNVLSQLTRITVAGQMDVEYRYSATQNNGQITQMKNWISARR